MTITNDIVIPKNFKEVFPDLFKVIEILAFKLGINIKTTGYVINSSTLLWLPALSGEKIDYDQLNKIDQDKKLSTAWLALNEAFSFILKPHNMNQGQLGPDFARFLIAKAIQNIYGTPLNKVVGTFLYTPQTKNLFEESIRTLVPNWADFASVISTILKNIIDHLVLPDFRDNFIKSHSEVWYGL